MNGVLAPVLDIGPPDGAAVGALAFSDRAPDVARYAALVTVGYRQAKVFAAAGHFPGLGSASQPVVGGAGQRGAVRASRSSATRRCRSTRAIEAGIPGIVVSNGLYAYDDFVTPATLSRQVMTGLLRDKLGFEGVTLTSDLTDPAVTALERPPRAAVQALRAGADLLYISAPAADQAAAYRAVLDGGAHEARLGRAAGRGRRAGAGRQARLRAAALAGRTIGGVLHALLTFVPVAALLTVTPGVSTALVVRSAARDGHRAARVIILGNSLAIFAWAVLAAVGVAAVVAASAEAYAVVKLVGAAVLIVLGLQALLHHRRGRGAGAGGAGDPPPRRPGHRAGQPQAGRVLRGALPAVRARGRTAPADGAGHGGHHRGLRPGVLLGAGLAGGTRPGPRSSKARGAGGSSG